VLLVVEHITFFLYIYLSVLFVIIITFFMKIIRINCWFVSGFFLSSSAFVNKEQKTKTSVKEVIIIMDFLFCVDNL